MKYLYNKLLSFFNTIQSKLAFYPTLLALIGLSFAFIMILLEEQGVSKYLIDHAPSLVVDNGNTALTILSSCITGLISMMVFSFSMVMLLLNQASTNYSPRLLPGLISDKNHQIILGTYMATILYCIFIAVSIQPTGDKYQIPGFSVLMGIIFTVICIWAFIYFIHNISQSIQINNILEKTYHTAKKRLQKLIKEEKDSVGEFPDHSNWFEYGGSTTGYYQNVSVDNLVDICEEKETRLAILPIKGSFVLKGNPFFRSEKELDEKTVKKILSNFLFARGELVADNYVLAFKQITEIIVKAMSPAINDPGTALNGIDYLNELFGLRMKKKDRFVISRNDKTYLEMNSAKFEKLMYNIMASIRAYCKKDIILVQKLALMFAYLQTQEAASEHYYHTLQQESEALLIDAQKEMDNEHDRKVLQQLSKKLNLRTDISQA